jgi:hypothetical protein
MAKKLFISSQSPFVEIPVTSAKDAEGKETKIIIGLRRYDPKEAQQKIDTITGLSEDEAFKIIKKEIIYIKNAVVTVYDEETLEVAETINVKDTRTVKSIEPFWEDASGALEVLTDMYLESTPWKGSLLTAYLKALYNLDFKEAEIKNS